MSFAKWNFFANIGRSSSTKRMRNALDTRDFLCAQKAASRDETELLVVKSQTAIHGFLFSSARISLI